MPYERSVPPNLSLTFAAAAACFSQAHDDQWEHEVDIVPPIVGKDAVLGCNGQGENCPVRFPRFFTRSYGKGGTGAFFGVGELSFLDPAASACLPTPSCTTTARRGLTVPITTAVSDAGVMSEHGTDSESSFGQRRNRNRQKRRPRQQGRQQLRQVGVAYFLAARKEA